VAAEPPEVEWWDKPLLDGGAYYTPPAPADQQDQQQQQQGSQGEGAQEDEQQQKGKEVIGTAGDGLEMRLRVGKLTRYVEHPIPLEPPDEGPPPAPQPLKLTKRWVHMVPFFIVYYHTYDILGSTLIMFLNFQSAQSAMQCKSCSVCGLACRGTAHSTT
jgi:hypothetical protein